MKVYQQGDQLPNGATVIDSVVIPNGREPIGLVLGKLSNGFHQYTVHRYRTDEYDTPELFWGNYLSDFRLACETYFKRIDESQS